MRVLFLGARFCYPLLKGDASRVYHQLRSLGQEHSITLLSGAEGGVSQADYSRVAELCERVVVVPLSRPQIARNLATGFFSSLPLQVSYYRSARLRSALHSLISTGGFDLVHVSLIRMAPNDWELQGPPVVLDVVDSLGLNLGTRRAMSRGPKRLGYEMEYRRMLAYERATVKRFSALLVTSPADAQALGGGDKIHVLPMGVDLDAFMPGHISEREQQTLVFTGNMGYPPNEEAALWFAKQVWDRVKAAHPQARWRIVGANPGPRLRSLQSEQRSIEVSGWVPDMAAMLRRATVAVCPLWSGSGIQMKVQEAMATATPVVATSTANRGVGAMPGHDLLIADNPDDFANALIGLLHDARLREKLGRAGRAYVEHNFSWDSHARRVSAIYEVVRASA